MSEPASLGEEVAKLLGAAQDWWHRVALDPDSATISTGSPECCWCPICQFVAGLRGERPEFAERLGDLQAMLAGVLRSFTDPAGDASDSTAAQRGQETEADGGRPRVQRIELSDGPAEPVVSVTAEPVAEVAEGSAAGVADQPAAQEGTA